MPRFYSTPRVLEGPKRMSCIYSCKAFPGRIRAVPQVGAIAPRHRHRRLSGCRFPLPCRILDTKGVEALSSARQSEAPGASSAPAWNQRSAKVHALLRADANRPRRRRRLGTDETEARRDADPRAGAGASVGDRQFFYKCLWFSIAVSSAWLCTSYNRLHPCARRDECASS